MNVLYGLLGFRQASTLSDEEHKSDNEENSDLSLANNNEIVDTTKYSGIVIRKSTRPNSNLKKQENVCISVGSLQSSVRRTDDCTEESDSLRDLRDSDRKRKAIWRARGHYAMFCLQNGSTEEQQRLFTEFVVKNKKDGLLMAKDFYDAERDFSDLKDNTVREELLENLTFAAGRKRGRYKKCNRITDR
jgi:hypothetical protein